MRSHFHWEDELIEVVFLHGDPAQGRGDVSHERKKKKTQNLQTQFKLDFNKQCVQQLGREILKNTSTRWHKWPTVKWQKPCSSSKEQEEPEGCHTLNIL